MEPFCIKNPPTHGVSKHVIPSFGFYTYIGTILWPEWTKSCPGGRPVNFGPPLPPLKFKRFGYGPNSSIRTLHVNWVQFCFILESMSKLVPNFGPRGPCLQSISILVPRIWFHVPHPSDGENMAKTMPFRRQKRRFPDGARLQEVMKWDLLFCPTSPMHG